MSSGLWDDGCMNSTDTPPIDVQRVTAPSRKRGRPRKNELAATMTAEEQRELTFLIQCFGEWTPRAT